MTHMQCEMRFIWICQFKFLQKNIIFYCSCSAWAVGTVTLARQQTQVTIDAMINNIFTANKIDTTRTHPPEKYNQNIVMMTITSFEFDSKSNILFYFLSLNCIVSTVSSVDVNSHRKGSVTNRLYNTCPQPLLALKRSSDRWEPIDTITA